MLGGYQRPVFSNPTTQFVEALATNGMSANYEIELPGRSPFWFVRAFALLAVENLTFEVALFSSASNATGVMATENYIGSWQFGAWNAAIPASQGYPTGADGLYKAYIDGNIIPFWDKDLNGQGAGPAHLHARLINRSAGTKSADAAGAVQIQFYVSLQGQQP
jgi:hypothetical protein